MTAAALRVLCLALVCSTIGTASEDTADYDTQLKMRESSEATDSQHNMEAWTNILYRNLNRYDENVNEILVDGNKDQDYTKKLNLEQIDDKIRTFDVSKLDHIGMTEDGISERNPRDKEDLELNVYKINYDEIYEGNEINYNQLNKLDTTNEISSEEELRNRRVKRQEEDRCEYFTFDPKEQTHYIMHPHHRDAKTYYNNSNCVTQINATSDDMVIELTFVDMFRIESHPDCAYDYLEIRDGLYGYSKLIDKVCGTAFPRQMTTSGPNAWLKFKSDDTIEYEGFKILVVFKRTATSYRIPQACFITLEQEHGTIDSEDISSECTAGSSQALDVLWTIKTSPDRKIYLNFTKFVLAKPNECHENLIEVFGYTLEISSRLSNFCGTVSNSVTTKGEKGEPPNVMHVRLYVTKAARDGTAFTADFNAFRTLDTTKEEKCIPEEEFDCEDNTCISHELMCDKTAQCRLKTDEDERCDNKATSTITQTHILAILIIFCLILSAMSFVFLFKCIRKLYQDHKIIKEHIRQSCEDRLDSISHVSLDPHRLVRDSSPRASLERQNHSNELVKKQRSYSKRKISSIDSSDFIQETHIDLEDEPWRREVDSVPIEREDIRVERNGRTRRSDMSRKEESIKRMDSMRSRTKESEGEARQKKEIRDVSVGAPDTKESGCQTRESLFQTDPPPSSDGSGTGTNSRGFSTFGYSGTTIARPTPPQTNTSEITIELLKQVPQHQENKPQKKISDRRPMSTETTRSAPDVIIVSKPIR